MKLLYLRAAVLKQYAQNWPKRLPSAIAQRAVTAGQDGFFVGALHSAFDVTELELLPLPWIARARQFDCVVVNSKSSLMKTKRYHLLEALGDIPRILLVPSAQASSMPSDEILDRFDLIYKREPFRDRGLYKISLKNAEKIRPTMLSCPICRIRKKTLAQGEPPRLHIDETSLRTGLYTYDVGFVGTASSPERLEVCEKLASLPRVDFRLQPSPKTGNLVPANLFANRVSRENYVSLLTQTKINLALTGLGEFTYRHLEIWAKSGFMLSSPAIREVELPGGLHLEGEHFDAFNNLDDLVDKILFYIENDSERTRIAKQGNVLFNTIYDFKKHGEAIRKSLSM